MHPSSQLAGWPKDEHEYVPSVRPHFGPQMNEGQK